MGSVKILTAEEFKYQYSLEEHDEGGYLGLNDSEIHKMLIEFAKMHVEAYQDDVCKQSWYDQFGDAVSEEEIRNIYPMGNIK